MRSLEQRRRAAFIGFRTIIACLLLFLLSIGVLLSQSRAPVTGAAWKIIAIKARTFDQASGQFTDETGSSANGPLKWVLVTVVVRGDTDLGAGTMHRISLTATEHGKTVFSKTTEPMNFSTGKDGKFSVPFWIEGDRCEMLKLTARVRGARNASVMTTTVKYVCGE